MERTAAAQEGTSSRKRGAAPAGDGSQKKGRQPDGSSAEAAKKTEQGMAAAQNGEIESLQRLLEEGWPVTSLDKYGGTALHWASGKGRMGCVELLLRYKSDPQARLSKGGGRGRTPLHYAARNGHLDVCKLLVCGADVPADAKAYDRTTPMHLAVWQGHLEVADWLLSVCDNLHSLNEYGCDVSHWAAMRGDVPTARWLVGKGVTMRTTNLVGHTSLHKAAQLGHGEFVRYLAEELGIDPRQLELDRDGNSPAGLARAKGHEQLGLWLDSFAGGGAPREATAASAWVECVHEPEGDVL
jgi:ankyrin repeat protein